MRRYQRSLILGVLVTLLTGCGGGAATLTRQPFTAPARPTVAHSAQFVVSVSANNETHPFPQAGAFSGTVTLPPATVVGQLAMQSSQIVWSSATQSSESTGRIVYFSLTFTPSRTITLRSSPGFSVTLPNWVNPAGRAFYYDLTNAAQTPYIVRTNGPAVVAGSTLTFTPSGPALTLTAGTPYLVVFYSVAAPPLPAIYVTNDFSAQQAGLLMFAPDANGDAEPARTLRGDRTGLTSAPDGDGLAVDARGKLYVTNSDTRSSDFRITVYGPGASGNAVPQRTIAGPHTGLLPTGIGIDDDANLYVSNFIAAGTEKNSITVYDRDANGDAPPRRTIRGLKTGLTGPVAIAADREGSVYVANSNGPDSVFVFNRQAAGNVPPARTITGPHTRMAFARGIALDAQRNVYVANFSGPSVTVYAFEACGDATPMRTIAGPRTKLVGPEGIAVDAQGNIYVAELRTTSILVFAAGAGGDVAPIRTLHGDETLLRNGPIAIAVGPP